MTDFRALCAELADALERLHKQSVTAPHTQFVELSNGLHPLPLGNDLLLQDHLTSDLLARARAELAVEAVGPSGGINGAPSEDDLYLVFDAHAEPFSYPDEKETIAIGIDGWPAAARDVLARYGSAPRPIPMSERLPGPEDCDAEGRCWFFFFSSEHNRATWCLEDRTYGCNTGFFTHWLPAHAILTPENADD